MTFTDEETYPPAIVEAFVSRDKTIKSLSKTTISRIGDAIRNAALNGKSGISGLVIDAEKSDTAEAIEVLLLMYGYAEIYVRPAVDFTNRDQYKMMLTFNWRTTLPY